LYQDRSIPDQALSELTRSWLAASVQVSVTSDRKLISDVADLTARGIKTALNLPGFAKELSGLVRNNWTRKTDGMPGYVLELGDLASLYHANQLRLGQIANKQADKERHRMKSSAALLFILTAGDTPEYWLEAGRALVSASLIATSNGLSHSVTAAAVEAGDLHLEVEDALGSKKRLQVVMRLGYSAIEPRHSPRMPLKDVLLH
jgi:hypothetical protein